MIVYSSNCKKGELKAWLRYLPIILLLLPILFVEEFSGWQVCLVTGSSMSPAIPENSLLLIKKTKPSGIKLNQIILYKEDKAWLKVAHRVVGIKRVNGELYFKTKGDANRQTDFETIPASQVIGVVKYTFTLPVLLANSILKLYRFRYIFLTLLVSVAFAFFFSENLRFFKK
jgi:signal peptidase